MLSGISKDERRVVSPPSRLVELLLGEPETAFTARSLDLAAWARDFAYSSGVAFIKFLKSSLSIGVTSGCESYAFSSPFVVSIGFLPSLSGLSLSEVSLPSCFLVS